jgi:hypothetical protein
MQWIAILVTFLTLVSFPLMGQSKVTVLKSVIADNNSLQQDLDLIFGSLNVKTSLRFLASEENSTTISCDRDSILLKIASRPEEKSATLYKALREMGFLFPHPLKQISPSKTQLMRVCGKTVSWHPTMKWRGSHLHTLHPNEWVHAFYMGRTDYAFALVRWLARNGQNLLDVSLLQMEVAELKKKFLPPYLLANQLGIHTGVSLGIALNQQNSFHLLNLFESYTGLNNDKNIKANLEKLFEALPLSFIVLEAGTSEFTSTDYETTLHWLNLAGNITHEHGIQLFTKVHVSTNQVSPKWGNYNFLPQYANQYVGILPHTVMFYGLLDKKAPMYGNKNFEGIKNFTLQEKSKRPTWYYPETSYWVGMDMDIPLFLTDYLKVRAQDYQWLAEQGIEGHFNFTSGHVLGGWLLDWNLALITDADYHFDPLIGVKLLGEDPKLWQEHMDFQHEWFKEKGVIAQLSSANLQDELSTTHRIHERNTMKELVRVDGRVEVEMTPLEESLEKWPGTSGIKNKELRSLLEVTKLRHEHAVKIRHAVVLKSDKNNLIQEAADLRLSARYLLNSFSKLETNYPELPLFLKHENPTAYKFGYVFPALTLYFWEREERQIFTNKFFPLRNNIYNIVDIVL